MIPKKPFANYKWRWLSVAPTEGLLDPPVLLGVLRVLSRNEGKPPSDESISEELSVVQTETKTSVNLGRNGTRNLIRNSGQYWKGLGLMKRSSGLIELTRLGREVASGELTRSEFASVMVQQTVLPNPWTYAAEDIAQWEQAGLEIHPLSLILEIVQHLGSSNSFKTVPFITTNELIKVVIPLAGEQRSLETITSCIIKYRKDKGTVKDWPDCCPQANDQRLAREFLLFLSNFGILRRENFGSRGDEHYILDYPLELDFLTYTESPSIFGEYSDGSSFIFDGPNIGNPILGARRKILTSVYERKNQEKFRDDIIDAYGCRCLLTGESIPTVLEAAHIIPVQHNGTDVTANGICLRVDVHRLFDAGEIRICSDGELRFSSAVSASPNYSRIGSHIQLPNFVNPENISWRYRYL